MKKDIHPPYQDVKVKCSCGANFTIGSTSGQDLDVEICSECHPFFTGTQKLVDTAGRLDKFKKRMEQFEKMQTQQGKGKKSKKEEDKKAKSSQKNDKKTEAKKDEKEAVKEVPAEEVVAEETEGKEEGKSEE